MTKLKLSTEQQFKTACKNLFKKNWNITTFQNRQEHLNTFHNELEDKLLKKNLINESIIYELTENDCYWTEVRINIKAKKNSIYYDIVSEKLKNVITTTKKDFIQHLWDLELNARKTLKLFNKINK